MAISSAKSRYPGSSCPGASHGGITCPGAICGLCLATDVDLKHTSLGERNSELGNRHWKERQQRQHMTARNLRIFEDLGNWKDIISWTLALTLWKIFSSCHSAVCFFWDRLDDLSACDCNILQLCRIAQKQNMYQQVEQVWNTDTFPLNPPQADSLDRICSYSPFVWVNNVKNIKT